MPSISNLITYGFLFLSLYFEVFMLFTYLENREDIKAERKNMERQPRYFPTVSIIVPCWNEATTIGRTVQSLLDIDYPKEKLDIILVDDGSTDTTWETMQKLALLAPEQIRIFHKENAGKHTALNFALAQSQSELVGCLDADSYADVNALKNIVLYFEEHPETSAVTPSVHIWKPQTFLQTIQSVEYTWAVFLRKMLSYVGAIYVTPGPFSIFRRNVFEKIGNYKKAYLTEDMELAVRMQANHMVIGHAHTATIYTSGPDTFKKLYKQRLRWTYGFIKNTFDYRFMFFRKEYGNLGVFMFPAAVLSIIAALYAASRSVFSLVQGLMDQFVKIRTVGFHLPNLFQGGFDFDLFYVNTQIIALVGLVTVIGTFIILIISRRITHSKRVLTLDIFYFMAVYAIIAPIWMFKAAYNALFSVTTNWR